MNHFTLGSLIRLQATFKVGTVNTDPTAITFKVRVPVGTITTYVYGVDAQLMRSAAGIYYVDYTTVAEGIHAWRMVGTGTAIAAEEQQFTVKDSRFTT